MMDDIQERAFVSFCLPHLPLSAMTAMDASRYVYDVFGIKIDWHVFSDELDRLVQVGAAEIDGFTGYGLTLYAIKHI